MSSLPWHAGNGLFLAAGFAEKKSTLLKQVAASERLAAVRPASRLEARPRPEMIATGIPEVDAISGGIPRGCLSEIYGPPSSGKTSLLLATMAAATRNEETCALVDCCDSFDPASASAAGVHFKRLLWVRCGVAPRSRSKIHHSGQTPISPTSGKKVDSEFRLEQVIKAADLILQSGGFGLVALDLAGIADAFVRRIPLASWFRFQRAVEHTKTALLVLSETPCAESCAALGLKLAARNQKSIPISPPETPTHAQLLESMRVEAEIVRVRLERKPAHSLKIDFRTQVVRAG
jgi:recA bacterial DNA recombination protein